MDHQCNCAVCSCDRETARDELEGRLRMIVSNTPRPIDRMLNDIKNVVGDYEVVRR